MVGKEENLTRGETPRFGVTRLPTRRAAAKRLSEKLSCARGDRETRIKEPQLDLFADRTSAQRMRANQLRLYVSSFAYVRMQSLRTRGAQGTELARAQGSTLRRKLLKVGTRIGITARRVWLSFSQAYIPMPGSLPRGWRACNENRSGVSPDSLTTSAPH